MADSKQVVCAGFTESAAERRAFIAGVWRPPRNGQAIIFCSCGYHLSSAFFFPRLFSAVGNWNVYHTSTHGVALVRI